MSLPDTIYESKLAHNDMRRERSMAIHANIMHLPRGDSILKRLLRRLRTASSRAIEARPRPVTADNLDANRPPAFSK